MMKIRCSDQRGFTLLELTVSLGVLLVLSGAMLGGMAAMQKNFRASEIRTALNDQLRSSLELMQQEIGQAGLAPSGTQQNGVFQGDAGAFSLVKTSQAIAGDKNNAQTIYVTFYNGSNTTSNPLTGMITYLPQGSAPAGGYPSVIIDSGANSEIITLTDVQSSTTPGSGQITAVFRKDHSSGARIYWHGVYPQGVVSPEVNPYSDHSLRLFGDIDGNNSLVLIAYRCPAAGDSGLTTDSDGSQWGPLTRTEYVYSSASDSFVPKGGSASTATTTMLENVRVATTASPTAADGCRFDYYDPHSNSYDSMVVSVSITLVARSLHVDPATNKPIVVTKSFMNIQPRNILAAYNIVQSGMSDRSSFLAIPQQLFDAFDSLGE